MKKIIILLVFYLAVGLLQAQIFPLGTTQNEFKRYFDENITKLDPLEGFWIRSSTLRQTTGDVQEPDNSIDMQVVIIKIDDTFEGYILENNIYVRKYLNLGFSGTLEKGTYFVKYLESAKPTIYGTKQFVILGDSFTYTTQFIINETPYNKKIIANTTELWRKLYPKNN